MAVEEPTELEVLESKYRKELEKWDHLGVDLGNIMTQGGLVHLSLRIDALTAMLAEKEVFTQDELNTIFLTKALEVLAKMREEVEPAVTAARLEAIKNGDFRRMH